MLIEDYSDYFLKHRNFDIVKYTKQVLIRLEVIKALEAANQYTPTEFSISVQNSKNRKSKVNN